MRTRSLLALACVVAMGSAIASASLSAAADVVAGAPPAGSIGHDVSWPQCGSTLPADGEFGIVGVTDGRAWSANPCLGLEYQWAASYPRTPDLYMNTANPAPYSSLYWPASGSSDPALCQDASSTADPGCAYDYGWHTAADAMATARSALPNLAEGTWWLDVETGNTWNGDSTSNAADIQGSIDYLIAQHVTGVGVYSTGYQWRVITGGYSASNAATYDAAWSAEFTSPNGVSGSPTWVAGASGPADAPSLCSTSFLATTTWMVQYIAGSADVDYGCGPAAPPPPDYSIAVPASISAHAGTTVTTSVTVTSSGDWSGTLTLSVLAPTRVSATLSTTSLSAGPDTTGTVALTLRSAGTGRYAVTLTATPGSGSTTLATHSTSLSLFIYRKAQAG